MRKLPCTEPVVCGLLLLAVAAVFGQTVRHDFVNFDDNRYVYDNPQVVGGPTIHGIAWAFTQSHRCNWHPLTWMSHMLDCQWFGLWPGGHHLTNVLLHAAATILLFLVLRQMTGRRWPSAFVAALFAIHPLHVESVAWVAERKDVLSGLFFMLTLGAYCVYARRPFSLLRYLAVVLLFALGLMAKPMLVTLPIVLLLLDFWPLGRFRLGNDCDGSPSGVTASVRTLLVEKLPLAAMAAGSCAVTLLVQGEAIAVGQRVSIPSRVANALVSYVAYLGQFFWPRGLSVFYPHSGDSLPAWAIGGAVVLLLGISAAAVLWSRRRPYLLVGWLWYLVTLLPVIGLVQVGEQAMADRYTYLTQIGLAISLAWGVAEVSRSWSARRWACGAGSAIVLAALAASACRQTSHWLNRETLWNHALSCNPQNALAHNNLGAALLAQGPAEEAIAHCQAALNIKPAYPEALSNLATALAQLGRIDEAIAHYELAVEIGPEYAEAHSNLALLLLRKGRVDEAIAHYRRTLEIRPRSAKAHLGLGTALSDRGRFDEAIAHCETALEIEPEFAEAHYNLGNALARNGRVEAAIGHYRKALEVQPGHASAHNNLGLALLRQGRVDEAIVHYRKALQLEPRWAETHNNLGLALQRQGHIDEAIVHHQKAIEIKPDYAQAHNDLGAALVGRGRADEAIAHWRQALAIDPQNAEAHQNIGSVLRQQGKTREALAQWREGVRRCARDTALLTETAWLMATSDDPSIRNAAEAVELAQRANRLSGSRDPAILNSLAAAYASAGRFSEAVETARRALTLAAEQRNAAMADALRVRLKLYEAGSPLHAAPPHATR